MIIFCKHSGQWRSFSGEGGITPLSEQEWNRLKPDIHIVSHRENKLLARCSIWQQSLPEYQGSIPAVIGHFEAKDVDQGHLILEEACRWIKQQGSEHTVGPMNANTWNSYRLITQSNQRPPFFIEPSHPPFYVDSWKAAGFEPMENFHSTEMQPITDREPRLSNAIERQEAAGVRIRNLDLNRYETELKQIYKVASEAFAPNLFYTPIEENDFIELYLPYRDKLDPSLVFIAEQNKQTVGFLFCLPDFNQRLRGESVDTLIFKTIAIYPRRELAGLGQWLMHLGHCRAAEIGCRSVIHALMTPESKVRNLGKDSFDIFRVYTLFKRSLTP